MSSKPVAVVLLGLGCLTAAAGGAYVASRHNASDPASAAVAASPASAPAVSSAPAQAVTTPQPVAETEAAVSPATPASKPMAEAAPVEPPPAVRPQTKASPKPQPAARPEAAASSRPASHNTPPAAATTPAPQSDVPAPQAAPVAPAAPAAWKPQPEPAKVEEPQPEPVHVPQFEELILPANAVIGLQVESSTSTERAHVEDRVDARVSRDVMAAGRVAIPAGSRVIGSVTTVERGGKVKEQARLAIRFHTLVLADGTQVPLHTEPVMRLGDAPAASSTKKIGGAAVGGAILGAILGGGKGAAAGGAIGAGAGTAAVMAGDRSAATLRQGEYLTVKLSSPTTITVPRREQ
jgi:type IV secretory pathway VirB10-like protein